jgi:hypothetical protein
MRSPSEPLGSFDRRDRAPGIECGAGWPAIPVQLLDRLETAAAAGCSGPVAEDAEALTAADAAMAVHRLLKTYDPKALAGRTGTTGTPSCGRSWCAGKLSRGGGYVTEAAAGRDPRADRRVGAPARTSRTVKSCA